MSARTHTDLRSIMIRSFTQLFVLGGSSSLDCGLGLLAPVYTVVAVSSFCTALRSHQPVGRSSSQSNHPLAPLNNGPVASSTKTTHKNTKWGNKSAQITVTIKLVVCFFSNVNFPPPPVFSAKPENRLCASFCERSFHGGPNSSRQEERALMDSSSASLQSERERGKGGGGV